MTDVEKREAARQFYYKWKDDKGEKQNDQSYWIDLLSNVLGIEKATDYIDFQKTVIVNGHTTFMDGYIKATRVIIEQKGSAHKLDEKEKQSDGTFLTPYEQAKRYNDNLPFDEKARWIVTCNFREIWIYDMNQKVPAPEIVRLENLPNELYRLEFLIEKKEVKISEEMQVSIDAGALVGRLYDAFLSQYKDKNNDHSLKSLNMLCVRLVFLLYAEDAGLFGKHAMFHDYMSDFPTNQMRKALIELFKVLDEKPEDRDEYLSEDNPTLAQFSYVNGGLFKDEDIEIPPFTDEIRVLLLKDASENFDWSRISPTIFGAVFESTLNPETRRKGGMHYTSIENIHKVIDPLFLDDLKKELDEIENIPVLKDKNKKLHDYQDKLSSLVFMDPAAGSGNFLTETYLSIRRLENRVIKDLNSGQMKFGEAVNPIKVSINQFYGIEINDFAVTVAKTALWIAESQMFKETEDILVMQMDFLPLKTNANIIEGNALRLNWEEIVPKDRLSYIMGNPPFVGTNYLSDSQRKDMDNLWKENRGKLDYVSCWYIKTSEFIQNTDIECAFVSTNSICQGEQANTLWKDMFNSKNIVINFAYRPFVWASESNNQAKVHVVIVGFSMHDRNNKQIIDRRERKNVSKINQYLLDSPIIFVDEQTKPISNVPSIVRGSQATDNGLFLFTKEEMLEFVQKEPNAKQYVKRFMMGKEFINNIERYCLWMPDISPKELKSMPLLYQRVQEVKEFRENSKNIQTRKSAQVPWRFGQFRRPSKRYIAFAKVSSERRQYIPFGFLTDDIIPGDKLFTIPNADLYLFGVITSNVHMAWMRLLCGRMKSDYSYSTTIVYNTFPWPTPTPDQKAEIEKTAQGILDARALYPDSSLADLYDPVTMPPELQQAHKRNNVAVMHAYGFDIQNTSEADCVAKLMQMYQKLVSSAG